MERLSSCYFCGDAVDAALESYPLVPDEHHPDIDTDREVVLCPTCRRKLTTVIEHVLEAAFDGSDDTELEAPTDILQDVEAGEPMIAEDVERIERPGATGVGGTDHAGANGDEEGTVEATNGTAADTSESDDADATSESADADDPWVTAGEAAGTSSDGVTDDESEADGDESDVDGDASTHSDAEGATAGEDTDDDAGDTDESADEDSASAASSGASGQRAGDGDAYTRSEYNRIVRLLQNRDFPVEIDEIEVVARNAYGIDEATCHAVLQALVDRGVVADRGETLVKT